MAVGCSRSLKSQYLDLLDETTTAIKAAQSEDDLQKAMETYVEKSEALSGKSEQGLGELESDEEVSKATDAFMRECSAKILEIERK